MNSYRRQEGYLPVQLVGIRALVAGFRFYRYNCKTTDRAIEVYSTLEEAKRVATINHTHVAGVVTTTNGNRHTLAVTNEWHKLEHERRIITP